MPEYTLAHKRGFFSRLSVTNQLILINLICFVASLILFQIYGESLFNKLALTPSTVLEGKNLWTLVTSMFLHASFFHLFANMFSLFFIGNFLEKLIGKKRFFWVYIFAGLIGGMFFVASGYIFHSDIPGVGASGAIFGLLGVLAVLVPYSKIYLIAGPLILIIIQVITAPFIPSNLVGVVDVIFNMLIILMILSMFSLNNSFRKIAVPVELRMWILPFVAIIPLVVIDFVPGIDLPIGNSAHIGGLVLGLIYGFYLRKKYPKKTKYISRLFSR